MREKENNNRDVKCMICNQPMYYHGDSRCEEEFTIIVEKCNKHVASFYVHEKCLIDKGFKYENS